MVSRIRRLIQWVWKQKLAIATIQNWALPEGWIIRVRAPKPDSRKQQTCHSFLRARVNFFFFPLKIKKLMDRVKDFISYFFELNISFLLVNNVGNKDHNLSLSTPLKLAIAVCLFFPPDDFWIWLTVVTVRFLALFHPGWVIQNLFQMTRRYDEWGSKAFLLLDRKFFSDVAQMEVLLIRELCRDADLSPRKILAGLFWQTWASMGPA